MSRPPKTPGGMKAVLYVRTTPDLITALDEIVNDFKVKNPGISISRADIVRWLLCEEIERHNRRKK